MSFNERVNIELAPTTKVPAPLWWFSAPALSISICNI